MIEGSDPVLLDAIVCRVRFARAQDVRRLARFMGLRNTGPVAPIRTSVIITLWLESLTQNDPCAPPAGKLTVPAQF